MLFATTVFMARAAAAAAAPAQSFCDGGRRKVRWPLAAEYSLACHPS